MAVVPSFATTWPAERWPHQITGGRGLIPDRHHPRRCPAELETNPSPARCGRIRPSPSPLTATPSPAAPKPVAWCLPIARLIVHHRPPAVGDVDAVHLRPRRIRVDQYADRVADRDRHRRIVEYDPKPFLGRFADIGHRQGNHLQAASLHGQQLGTVAVPEYSISRGGHRHVADVRQRRPPHPPHLDRRVSVHASPPPRQPVTAQIPD